MSYTVLARKWRPRNFDEVVGQQHVIRALVNALDNGRMHHALLLTGTRGVGKTTLGRIIARCLNCETGESSNPCGECSSCQEIEQGRFVDLIEVDAASRTKVDDTRELLDNVQYAPTRGRYKVYLIDEVHMLSRHSFNALLKTLEEPPSHVKFLLATTDPQKLPVTILSRCLQFNLKRLPVSEIRGHLDDILQREGLESDVNSVRMVAEAAEGSMRDALSLLDQAIAHCGGKPDEVSVREMLGSIQREQLVELLDAIAAQDADRVLATLNALEEQVPDYEAVLGDLGETLQRIALLQQIPGAEDPDRDHAVMPLLDKIDPQDVQLYYQIVLLGRRDLRWTPDTRVGFEMTVLRMMAFEPEPHAGSAGGAGSTGGASRATPTVRSASATAKPAARSSAAPAPAAPETAAPAPAASAPAARAKADPSVSGDMAAAADASNPPRGVNANGIDWAVVQASLSLKGLSAQLAQRCVLGEVDGDGGDTGNSRWRLWLQPGYETLNTESSRERIQSSLTDYLGHSIRLEIEVRDATAVSPARKKENDAERERNDAVQAIENDPVVDTLKNRFGGTVRDQTIKPVATPDNGEQA